MNRRISLLALSLLLILLCGLEQCPEKPSTNIVELTLFHTNDIHSHFRAEATRSEKNPYSLGGLARLKTLVDNLRATKKNSLLLDAGDWSEGTVFFNSDGGSNMLRLLNTIGYNAVVVGNHDFFNGPSQLASTIERAQPTFPVLGANKELSNLTDRDRVNRWVQDYAILETSQGIKVAIIGLLTDEYAFYDYFKPGVITNAAETASAIAKQIYENKKADVIVLLSHNNIDTNIRLAKIVPWINVVVSGHSHFKTAEPIVVTNGGEPVYVVEAKAWGQFLGELTLNVDRDKRQVRMKSYALHPVSQDLAENAQIAAMVDQEEASLKEKFGTDIFHDHIADSTDEFLQSDFHEGALGNLLADAYRSTLHTQLGLEVGSLVSTPISTGALTSADLYNVAPHIYHPLPSQPDRFPHMGQPWTLHKLTLSGSDLLELLNLVLLSSKLDPPFTFIAASGAEIHYSLRDGSFAPVKSVGILDSLKGNYVPIQSNASYTIALHDGMALSLKLITEKIGRNVDISHIEDMQIPVPQAVNTFIKAHSPLRAQDYEPKSRYQSIEADLGVYENSIELVRQNPGYAVRVRIRNYGLAPSQTGFKLRVLRSEPNDPVHDSTAGNEKIQISPDLEIPTLAPSAEVVLDVPWVDLPGPGVYAVRVQITGSGDGNSQNDQVMRHFYDL